MDTVLKEIPLDAIILDKENPRLRFSQIEKGLKKWHEQEIEEAIRESLQFNKLLDSIRQYGVKDPIWLHHIGDSKYEVVEGNMRVLALRLLSKSKTAPPSGITYGKVQAHIIPEKTDKVAIEIQKAILQTGKNPWGAFNEAAHIFGLHAKHKMGISEIANMLGKSMSYIRNEIDNFQFYLEFIEFQRKRKQPVDPRKYSFFKDAPPMVRVKFFKTTESRKKYFGLILPNTQGITRIPSVALKGGLRTFAKFIEDDRTLTKFLSNERITVDDAFFEYTEKNVLSKQPWVKKLPTVINGMRKLTNSERKKLLDNPQIHAELSRLAKELTKFLS